MEINWNSQRETSKQKRTQFFDSIFKEKKIVFVTEMPVNHQREKTAKSSYSKYFKGNVG